MRNPRTLTYFVVLCAVIFAASLAAAVDYPTTPEAVRQEGVPVGELKRGAFADSKKGGGASEIEKVHI